jgi:hypothetical protein
MTLRGLDRLLAAAERRDLLALDELAEAAPKEKDGIAPPARLLSTPKRRAMAMGVSIAWVLKLSDGSSGGQDLDGRLRAVS